MALRFTMSNTAAQLVTLGNLLPKEVEKRYSQNFRPMVMDIVDELERRIEQDVFGKQAEPGGASWPRAAPITLKVRQTLAKQDGGRLGGRVLRGSFKKGKRGNKLTIRRRQGFEFGSNLRARGHLVGKTFQSSFKIPKSASDKKKAARVRAFMGWAAGVHAPAPGKQLRHPGRKIIEWTPKWIRASSEIVNEHLVRVFNKARPDVARGTKAVQKQLDVMRRTSTAG